MTASFAPDELTPRNCPAPSASIADLHYQNITYRWLNYKKVPFMCQCYSSTTEQISLTEPAFCYKFSPINSSIKV